MRALLTLAIVTMTAACVGGPGPLPTEDDQGIPVDGTRTSASESSQSQGKNGSGDGRSGGDQTPTACVVDTCTQLTCTCGRLANTKVRQCTAGGCAKTCAEAGCT